MTNISVLYLQDADDFIATKVFPVVPVEKQSDLYFIFTKNDWFRDEAQVRQEASESAGGGYGLSTTNYYCTVYAFHKDVSDKTRQNTDNPLDPDRNATRFITQRLMLREEIQWATDYFATGIWGTDITGSATVSDATHAIQWDQTATSDPITDVEKGKDAILGVTGFMPNTLVIGYSAWRVLKNHPDIVDRYKYTTNNVITEEMVAKLFDLDRILVAKAIKATNQEGQTAAYAYIAGKNALLCYTADAPGIETPSAGYIFMWRGISGGLGQNIGVSRFRMEQLKADRIEGEIAFADKVVGTDLGYFWSGIVA